MFLDTNHTMTVRKDLLAVLSSQPRSVSSLARELGFGAATWKRTCGTRCVRRAPPVTR